MINFVIAPQSLHRLRRRLSAAGPDAAAEILEEAGFATGERLVAAWRERVAAETGVSDASRLDAEWFGPLFGAFCRSLGWGSLEVAAIGDRALLLTSTDWAESEPDAGDQPGCYFTRGCLAAFLTAQAGAPLGVLEVECRTRGGPHCRFLAGSTETLAAVYDLITAGGGWRDAFAAADLPG